MAKSTLILDDELFARAFKRLRNDASGRGAPTQILSDQEPTQILSDQEPTQIPSDQEPTQIPSDQEPTQIPSDQEPTQIPSDQEIERALSQLRQPSASVSQPKEHTGDLAAEPTIDTGFDQQDISSLKTADDAPASSSGKNSNDQGSGRSKWTAARWTVAGFVVGIAFWHVVGFWDFVSTVVLDHEHRAANKAANQLRPSVRPKFATAKVASPNSATPDSAAPNSTPPNSTPAVSLAAAQQPQIKPPPLATQITTGSLARQTSRLTAAPPNPARAAQLKRVLAGAPLLREPCLTLVKAAPGGSAWAKPCAADNADAAALTLRPASARVDRLERQVRLERPKSKVRLEPPKSKVRLKRQVRLNRLKRPKPKVRPELLDDRIKQLPTLPAKETAPSPWSIVVDKKR